MNKNEKHTKKEEKRESRRQTILVAIIESRCISNGNNVHFDDEKKREIRGIVWCLRKCKELVKINRKLTL